MELQLSNAKPFVVEVQDAKTFYLLQKKTLKSTSYVLRFKYPVDGYPLLLLTSYLLLPLQQQNSAVNTDVGVRPTVQPDSSVCKPFLLVGSRDFHIAKYKNRDLNVRYGNHTTPI